MPYPLGNTVQPTHIIPMAMGVEFGSNLGTLILENHGLI